MFARKIQQILFMLIFLSSSAQKQPQTLQDLVQLGVFNTIGLKFEKRKCFCESVKKVKF